MKNNVFKFKPVQALLLVVPVLVFLMIIVAPVIYAVIISFTDWNGGMHKEFVGFANYIRVFQDKIFRTALINNILIIIITIVFQVTLAFFLAVIISGKHMKLKEFHRNAIFIPVVLSPVIVGLLWWMIYDVNDGLLNTVMRALHLDPYIQKWLDDPNVALFSVGASIVWQYVGEYMVIFLAGLQNISSDIYEAAEMDGATGWKQMIHIKIPLLYPTFVVAFILAISGGLKIFDHIYVMTGGGPGRATTVLAQYAYDMSFKISDLGYGSAISVTVILFGIILIGGLQVIPKLVRKKNKYEN